MAMIKFWRGAAAPQERNADTLYFDKSGKLYLGKTLIADVTTLDTNTVNSLISTALANYYTKIEIDAIIAALDAEVKGEGTYVDVTVTEVDGKITAVAVDDSAIDAKFADYQPKGDYKTKQTAVADAGLTGAKVLKNLSQDANGVISYTTRDLTPADISAEAAGTAAGLIAGLDAEKSSAAVEAGKGIQVTVKEVDGKIDEVAVSGNYDNLYDAKGAAATAEENAKGYTDSEITGLEFDLSEDGKELSLKNKAGTAVATLDTTKFVKDGMISSVAISEDGTKLVITWNTDAGITATEIPLTELVDVMTGVDGTTITVNVSADDKISAEVKTGSLTDGHIAANAAIAKGKLANDVQTSLGLADSAVQPGDIGTAAAKNVEFFEVAGAAATVQGSTTHTVKDCVDAINTMNNNVEGALGEVKNIVEMLTWIEG